MTARKKKVTKYTDDPRVSVASDPIIKRACEEAGLPPVDPVQVQEGPGHRAEFERFVSEAQELQKASDTIFRLGLATSYHPIKER